MSEDRTMQTARTLPYSPKEIYRAFASADLLALWWGPEGFSNTFETFEFREGGQWVFVMHAPDGNSYHNQSVFLALEPEAKIVIRHDCAPHFTLTVGLAPVSEGTHLTWVQVFDDAETAQAVKARVGSANEQNIDRLAGVLGKASGSP